MGRPAGSRPILYDLLANRPLPHSPIPVTSSVLLRFRSLVYALAAPTLRFEPPLQSTACCSTYQIYEKLKTLSVLSFSVFNIIVVGPTLASERTVLAGNWSNKRMSRYNLVIFDNVGTTGPESTEPTATTAVSFI